jgi:hypothetical protein
MRKFLLTIQTSLLLASILVLAQVGIAYSQQRRVLSSPNGRYVFGQISDFRSDQFLLDTKTGRLWGLVVDKEKK